MSVFLPPLYTQPLARRGCLPRTPPGAVAKNQLASPAGAEPGSRGRPRHQTQFHPSPGGPASPNCLANKPPPAPKGRQPRDWGRIPLRGPASQPLTPEKQARVRDFGAAAAAGQTRDRGSAPSASLGPPEPALTTTRWIKASLSDDFDFDRTGRARKHATAAAAVSVAMAKKVRNFTSLPRQFLRCPHLLRRTPSWWRTTKCHPPFPEKQ